MTIGIAASGPHAAKAIIAALAAVEAIGTGAIGGFVSLAAISGGVLHRAQTQTGGGRALFEGPTPPHFLEANLAVLMSSGPNRPAPLAQFTPGDAQVGLVTGHRFPNAPSETGAPLNQEVLALMRSGLAPEAAISDSLGRNGMADAGLIALSVGGEIYAANSPLLDSFEDRGSAILRGPSGATVAVLHNAILPYRGLALIAAEIALNIIDGTKQAPDFIRIDAGLRIIPALDNAVDIDAKGNAIAICVADPHHVAGRRSFGLGYHAIIRRGGRLCGRLAYEPYLVAVDGRLVSIDGADTATVPAVLESPSF